MLRHIIAAAGGPRRSSSFGSAVLITYPPTCAPLPLHYSCDSGTSCCDAQRGLWHTDIGRACCGTQLRQRTSAIRGPHLLPAHPPMITTSFYTTVEHSRTFVQQGRGGGSHTIDTGSAFNRQFFSVLSVQWRHQRHHGYQSRWCYDFSAAVLVGINRSTNSVGLPITAFSGLIYYLHRAVRRLSGTAMYRTHFPKPLPWRGRAVDRSTTVHRHIPPGHFSALRLRLRRTSRIRGAHLWHLRPDTHDSATHYSDIHVVCSAHSAPRQGRLTGEWRSRRHPTARLR